jgi:hypothetical protein
MSKLSVHTYPNTPLPGGDVTLSDGHDEVILAGTGKDVSLEAVKRRAAWKLRALAEKLDGQKTVSVKKRLTSKEAYEAWKLAEYRLSHYAQYEKYDREQRFAYCMNRLLDAVKS